MRLTATRFAFFALLLLSAYTAAQSRRKVTFMGTGADLVDRCKLPSDLLTKDTSWLNDMFMCAAFVEGVIEANEELGPLNVCFPEKMNGLSLPADVVNYRKNHPDRLGWSAAKFALEAVRDAYPCQVIPK